MDKMEQQTNVTGCNATEYKADGGAAPSYRQQHQRELRRDSQHVET